MKSEQILTVQDSKNKPESGALTIAKSGGYDVLVTKTDVKRLMSRFAARGTRARAAIKRAEKSAKVQNPTLKSIEKAEAETQNALAQIREMAEILESVNG